MVLTEQETAALPYRPCVGVMVLNSDGLVFVAQRIDTPGESWQMPQGGINEGEDPFAAAKRELLEETSIKDVEFLAESADWHCYDLPQDLIGKVFKGKYRGQKQKWFAVRFKGQDSDIDTETSVPEFSRWKWVKASSLPDLIVPFKRALYQSICEEFRALTSS